MMSFNSGWALPHVDYDAATGCITWTEDAWPEFERRLARPASQQGYFYVRDDQTGTYVGHVHYEISSGRDAHIGLNVIPVRRGVGLGVAFMKLLLERVWQSTDAPAAVNEFEDDRIEAVRLHRRCGFVPDVRTTDVFGRPTRTWRLRRPASR